MTDAPHKFRVWDGHRLVYPHRNDRYWLDFHNAGREWTLCESDTETGRWVASHSGEDASALMQYTGLTDAEGREIYEGDIIKKDGECAIVEWSVDGWVWDGKDLWLADTGAVVGNRYENPGAA